MSDKISKGESLFGKLGSFSRFLVYFILFGTLPIFIGCFLCLNSLDLEEEASNNFFRDSLEQDVSAIKRYLDPMFFLQTKLAKFSQLLFKDRKNNQYLIDLHSKAQFRWNFSFEPYVFDGQGKLITPGKFTLRNRHVVQKIWKILCLPLIKAIEEQARYKKLVSSFLGFDFQIETLKKKRGQIMTFRSERSDGAIFWEKAGGNKTGGTILIVWKIPNQEEIFESHLLKSLKERFSLLLIDRTEKIQNVGKKFDGAPVEIVNFFQFFQENFFFQPRLVWTKIPLGRLTIFLGKPRNQIEKGFLRKVIIWFSVILLAILFVLWYRWIFLNLPFYFSIRWKLIFLFFFAMVTPLMGVAFLGFRTLQDRKEILITRTIQDSKMILNRLDAEFLDDSKEFIKFCRQIRDDPEMKTSPQVFREKAKKFVDQDFLQYLEIRDLKGNLLVRTTVPGLLSGLESMFDAFGKLSIIQYLGNRLKETGTEIANPPDRMIQNLLQSPQTGMGHILLRKDMVHKTQFGVTFLYWYWDIIQDPSNPAAFVTILQTLTPCFHRFLEKKLIAIDSNTRNKDFLLLVRDDDLGTIFPKGISINQKIENLFERIRISRQIQMERISWNNRPFFVIGMPGKTLQGFSLLSLVLEEKVFSQLFSIKSGIILGLCFALLLALSFGIAISETFLRPISEISQGLDALRCRDSSYRVSWYRPDELGDLAKAFNKMAEDLNEMELAKVVQESLIPNRFPDIPGFQGKLSYVTASKIGGDYCDIVPLNDGRFLLVIGDVSGHGVGAALLVAMIKAAVFQFSENPGTLEELFSGLHHMVFHHFRRQLFMTFLAALLDPASGKVIFSNAGHPFPVICREDGKTQEIQLVHVPLGARELVKPFNSFAETLFPCDSLYMFTDGFYEVVNSNGEMFGYDRLRNSFSRLNPMPTEEILQILLKDFQGHQKSKTPDDDSTLMILRRF